MLTAMQYGQMRACALRSFALQVLGYLSELLKLHRKQDFIQELHEWIEDKRTGEKIHFFSEKEELESIVFH